MLCALTIQERQFFEMMCKCLLSEILLATYLYIRLEPFSKSPWYIGTIQAVVKAEEAGKLSSQECEASSSNMTRDSSAVKSTRGPEFKKSILKTENGCQWRACCRSTMT